MRKTELPVWTVGGPLPKRWTFLFAMREINSRSEKILNFIAQLAPLMPETLRVGVLVTSRLYAEQSAAAAMRLLIGLEDGRPNFTEANIRIATYPVPTEHYSHAAGINLLLDLFPMDTMPGKKGDDEVDDFVFLFHDDIEIEEDTPEFVALWLQDIANTLLLPDVGLLVPRMSGDCPSPIQAQVCHYSSNQHWYYDCTEYVSEAALFFKMSTFRQCVGRIPDRLSGYGFQGTHIQKRMSVDNRRTVVFHTLAVYHEGNETYGLLGERAVQQKRWDNIRAYCGLNGVSHEYEQRPGENRIAVGAIRNAWAIVVDSKRQVQDAMKYKGNIDEWAIIDASPGRRIFDYWCELRRLGKHRRVSYVPLPDETPPDESDFLERLATSLPSTNHVTISDLRRKHAFSQSSGVRVRAGFDYLHISRIKELHLGFLSGCGIGDLIMTTPGIAALKRQYPDLAIHCHAGWECGEVFRENPDVEGFHVYSPRSNRIPIDIYPASGGNANEGTIRHLFMVLGVPVRQQADRRMRLFLSPDEISGAINLLHQYANSWAGERSRFIGVQVHGSWATKQWAHLKRFVSLLLEKEPQTYVVLLGHRLERGYGVGDLLTHERVIPLMSKGTVRQALATVALMDKFVGFDSGLTVAAAALHTPTVALVGSHNPRGLIGDSEAPNMVFIRERTPNGCLKKYGRSCRSSFRLFGQNCPLRQQGSLGADCIDDITPEEVYRHLAALPDFDGLPLKERYAKPAYIGGRYLTGSGS